MIFKGHNSLLLNEVTVAQAIQDYLNVAITSTDDHVEVLSVVDMAGSPRIFRVSVKALKEKQ